MAYETNVERRTADVEHRPGAVPVAQVWRMPMSILVNGEAVDVGEMKTVSDLVGHFGLSPQSIIIEHNGAALNRREWANRSLADGDRIEFVRVVAGG